MLEKFDHDPNILFKRNYCDTAQTHCDLPSKMSLNHNLSCFMPHSAIKAARIKTCIYLILSPLYNTVTGRSFPQRKREKSKNYTWHPSARFLLICLHPYQHINVSIEDSNLSANSFQQFIICKRQQQIAQASRSEIIESRQTELRSRTRQISSKRAKFFWKTSSKLWQKGNRRRFISANLFLHKQQKLNLRACGKGKKGCRNDNTHL